MNGTGKKKRKRIRLNYEVYRDTPADRRRHRESALSMAVTAGRKRITMATETAQDPPVEPQQEPECPACTSDAHAADMGWNGDEGPDDFDGLPRPPPAKKSRVKKDPVRQWEPYRDEFLDEVLRDEGLGDAYDSSDFSDSSSDSSLSCDDCGTDGAAYRCRDCLHGPLFCASCICGYHKWNPLHRIERWNGQFYEKTELRALGLRIQLGHRLRPCPMPSRCKAPTIVLHINGIHAVDVDLCGCGEGDDAHPRVQLMRIGWWPATTDKPMTASTWDMLDFYDILACQSKCNMYDYYWSISRFTDNTDETKYRYKEFARCTREHRHVLMAKRAGRGNDDDGISGTPEGGAALLCPACPQPGKNLPIDWRNESADRQ